MKQVNVYTFEELSEQAKKTVLNNMSDINVMHDWYEHTIDSWKEKLKDIGFLDAKIDFSGFGNQGDGCSFYATLDLEDHLINEFEPLKNEDTQFECRNCNRPSWLWKFEQTNFLSNESMDSLSDKFIEYINEYQRDLSSEIYEELEKEFEYITSDEAISECLTNNEYYFLPDGTLACS